MAKSWRVSLTTLFMIIKTMTDAPACLHLQEWGSSTQRPRAGRYNAQTVRRFDPGTLPPELSVIRLTVGYITTMEKRALSPSRKH